MVPTILFSIDVVAGGAASTDRSINGNWYVSGNIQVFLDKSSAPTTGKITSYTAPDYGASDVTGAAAAGESTSRKLRRVHYISKPRKSLSTHNGLPVISDDYSYPLDIDFLLVTENNASGWNTILNHGFNRKYLPNTLTPFNEINTKRFSTGSFLTAPNGTRVVANGTAVQDFSYADLKLNSYKRHVEAINSNVTSDYQSGTLTWTWPWTWGKLVKGAAGAHSDYVGRLPIARDSDIIF
ncbi:peptide-N(4)-(N-acetyl-beta-glucosaminyl)asparagine amidase A [Ceratobasidium sp. AG-Ba]|nr:peptide-N(4)-(N-acetyl-beta-glucosaminyl)asparagine amidase A [Ceratobasidium sp. AG-Ba]